MKTTRIKTKPKITEETKKETRTLIYNPVIKIANLSSVDVMRIELNDEFTRIDFVHYASRIFDNGGWVQMNKSCFIKPCGTELKLKMIKAVNIPIAPVKHIYKSNKECLYYTLYFPALPKDTKKIDIIELETSDPSFFNFYGVAVEQIKKEIIIIPN